MKRIRDWLVRFDRWCRIRTEVSDGARCEFCLERYVGLARDCACTNWGGFIGV